MSEAEGKKTRSFSHHAEEEIARLLDYYQIRWVYEPKSFTLREDERGRPKRQFTPDFYLPDYDLYLEVTTLRQRLMTRKKQNVRLVRELYPQVRIKMFSRRDVQNLLQRYGLDDPQTKRGASSSLPGS
jgi:hypothetical protein